MEATVDITAYVAGVRNIITEAVNIEASQLAARNQIYAELGVSVGLPSEVLQHLQAAVSGLKDAESTLASLGF